MNKFALIIFVSFFSFALSASSVFEKYFSDTYQSLEIMRNISTGLVRDSMNVDLIPINDPTSPSNIGLDILVQLEAQKHPDLRAKAIKNVKKILLTLHALSYHHPSGLFFVRYSSDGKIVMSHYLSSIDNLHLAFSLWVIAKIYAPSFEKRIAQELFTRMNFSLFYHVESGLVAGGASYQNGIWTLEKWNYDYLGSEGRSLYGIGHAIGLFSDPRFIDKAVGSLSMEMNGSILRLWDGGAFQLLLPRLLINEERYSSRLKESFSSYTQLILNEGNRLAYPVPAAFSASQVSPTEYNGKSGSPELVSTRNEDFRNDFFRLHWDEVFTPHAAFLVAPFQPDVFAKIFQLAESLGTQYSLYQPGRGWLDGLHVKGQQRGLVVPVFLSLDQAMIALASSQIISQEGMTVGSRAVYRDRKIRAKLFKFYCKLDQKLGHIKGVLDSHLISSCAP